MLNLMISLSVGESYLLSANVILSEEIKGCITNIYIFIFDSYSLLGPKWHCNHFPYDNSFVSIICNIYILICGEDNTRMATGGYKTFKGITRKLNNTLGVQLLLTHAELETITIDQSI